MVYENFVSDLPGDNRVTFGSAEETQEVMASLGVDQDMKQLGKGVYRADMSVRPTKQVELYADRFSKAVSMYLEPPAGSIGLLIPRTVSGIFHASGTNVSNDHLVFVHADQGTDIVAPDLIGSEAITISKSRFDELAKTLYPSMKLQEITCAIQGDTAHLDALRKCILELINQQAEPNEEQLCGLIASFISWMDNSINDYSNEKHLIGICKKRRVARSAQEYIHANFRQDVHLKDLCRASSVGVRTLQRSFREYFDLTISEYQKVVRLDAAKRELAAGDPSQDSVSNIALKNGCKHLGRFSVEFHERFGTVPSDVLNKKH